MALGQSLLKGRAIIQALLVYVSDCIVLFGKFSLWVRKNNFQIGIARLIRIKTCDYSGDDNVMIDR